MSVQCVQRHSMDLSDGTVLPFGCGVWSAGFLFFFFFLFFFLLFFFFSLFFSFFFFFFFVYFETDFLSLFTFFGGKSFSLSLSLPFLSPLLSLLFLPLIRKKRKYISTSDRRARFPKR